MGYIEKKVLMEVLTSEGGFTDAELSFIDNTLDEDELNEKVQLHNKDECFIILAVQNKVSKKLEKLKEEN